MITIQEIGKFYFVNLVCWDRGVLRVKKLMEILKGMPEDAHVRLHHREGEGALCG